MGQKVDMTYQQLLDSVKSVKNVNRFAGIE